MCLIGVEKMGAAIGGCLRPVLQERESLLHSHRLKVTGIWADEEEKSENVIYSSLRVGGESY